MSISRAMTGVWGAGAMLLLGSCASDGRAVASQATSGSITTARWEQAMTEPETGMCVRVGGEAVGGVVAENATTKDDGTAFTRYGFGKHVVDTPLPNGYPSPTPPGAIELKRYPSVRRAEVSRQDDPDGALFGMIGGKNAGFWPLFRHIEKRGIPMTAGEGKDEAWRMAFLYRTPELGPEGKAERGVVVRDLPPITVLSLGVSGNSDVRSAERSLATLRAWLAANPSWKELDMTPPRVLNYNDPFTRPQWSEVQLAVGRQ